MYIYIYHSTKNCASLLLELAGLIVLWKLKADFAWQGTVWR